MNKPDHQNASENHLDGLVDIVRTVFNTPKQGATEDLPILDTDGVDDMVEDGDEQLTERRLR